MIEIKDLKKEHKRLETITKKTTKKRLNESLENKEEAIIHGCEQYRNCGIVLFAELD